MDSGKIRQTGDAAGPQTRGDDEFVVAEFGAVAEREGARRGVDRAGRGTEHQFDAVLTEELARPEGRVVAIASQDLLRQGRAVVGQVRLVADEHEFALVSGAAQLLGGTYRRQAGAHDDDALRRTLGLPLVRHPRPILRFVCDTHARAAR